MIICKKCGTEISENWNYCDMCGTAIALDSKELFSQSGFTEEIKPHFIQAKCSNCAANLEVDSSKDMAICPCCGTPYIMTKRSSSQENKASDFEIVAGELRGYKGTSAEVVIPQGVTYIGENAFQGQGITRVIIPDSVVYIKQNAFKDCFMLKSVNIPASMDAIEHNAFYGDEGLTIIWPSSWNDRKESKLKVAAQMKKRRLYFLCSDKAEITANQNVTLYYCGRSKKLPYYCFCEGNYFNVFNSRSNSVFDYFYDIESLDAQDMYKDLESLLNIAGIDNKEIETVNVPFYGWKTGDEGSVHVVDGKVQLYKLIINVDYGYLDCYDDLE